MTLKLTRDIDITHCLFGQWLQTLTTYRGLGIGRVNLGLLDGCCSTEYTLRVMSSSQDVSLYDNDDDTAISWDWQLS